MSRARFPRTSRDPRYPSAAVKSLKKPLALSAALTSTLVAGAAFSGPIVDAPPPGKASVVLGKGKLSVHVTTAPKAVLVDDKDKDKDKKEEKVDAKAAKETEKDTMERARRGVVVLEKAGEVVGLGTVLKGDGRVITALSNLGDGNGVDVRYADGSVAHARVGHSDRVWDLAMLVPQVGKWTEGLAASNEDAMKSGVQLRSFLPGKNKVQPATLVLKGRKSLLGADEHVLRDVFDVGTKLSAKEIGSPIVDDSGDVVGLLARACLPIEKGPCAPTSFGVPADAVKAFLRTAPKTAVQPAPWLGIQGVSDKVGGFPGVRIVGVSPDSPADEAGIRALKDKDKGLSDLVVAVDDTPVSSPEALSKAVGAHGVGDRVKLLVLREGKLRDVVAVLKPVPGRDRD